MESSLRPIIAMFGQHAALLELKHEPWDPDEALLGLAAWMAENFQDLEDEDVEALVHVGGVLFRGQLRRLRVRLVK